MVTISGRHRKNRLDASMLESKSASFSPTISESGKTFLATAALTATLPAVAISKGVYFRFVNGADTNLTITAPAGTLVVFNNAAATSIAFSTVAEKIGNAIEVLCDGAKWYAIVSLAAETVTPTIS